MESASKDYSRENVNISAVAETPESCSPDGAGAAGGSQAALTEEENCFGTGVTVGGGAGAARDTAVNEKRNADRSEADIHKDGPASRGSVEQQVISHREHSLSQSGSSVEKTKVTRITLSDMPVTVDEDVDHSKVAEEERAEEGRTSAAASPSSGIQEKGPNTEKLRFRSTLATFINDRKGIYGEWQAKEESATAAAKELLQMLAERVENLLNEATAVTGRLTQRRNTIREEDMQRRARSKKMSSSLFHSYEPDFACVEQIEGRGENKESNAENQSDHQGGTDDPTFRGAVAVESDISIVKGVAVEAVENLLNMALSRREETLENHRHEGRLKEGAECASPDRMKSPVTGQDQRASPTEQLSSGFEKSRSQIISGFSRSSLESYDAGNFPEDLLLCRPQESQKLAAGIRKEVDTSACEAKAYEDPQLKRDKIWKIFGRETQAGRLLYQLYKPAEPGGDIVYPIPKSVKDLRGNPNFRVLSPASSSSLAAAAGRHPKRRQVKVAVPRVGRHAARTAAAAGGSNSNNRKFEKGNFLSGRGPGGKRSVKQIAKETEKRRQQILDEASSRGVVAAAMGLKRDREKVLLLQKLPYSACSLLPEAARLPPLSARDRSAFFIEKVTADRASLYSARSPSPCSRVKNNGNEQASNSTSSKRSSSSHTSKYCSSSPRSNNTLNGRRGNKWEASLGRGIVDPCVQTLIPYVAAARQRYRKKGAIDAETGMTEEQKHLFVQTLREIQLRKQKLENLQKALPDHVLAASLAPLEQWKPGNNTAGVVNTDDGSYSSDTRPSSTNRGKSRPQSGAEATKKQVNLFTTCFSPDVAKSRLAQRTILQQLQDEAKLKREIQERIRELETLISISDAQQRELQQKGQEGTQCAFS